MITTLFGLAAVEKWGPIFDKQTLPTDDDSWSALLNRENSNFWPKFSGLFGWFLSLFTWRFRCFRWTSENWGKLLNQGTLRGDFDLREKRLRQKELKSFADFLSCKNSHFHKKKNLGFFSWDFSLFVMSFCCHIKHELLLLRGRKKNT